MAESARDGKEKEFDVIAGLSHGLSPVVLDIGFIERAKQREVLYKSLQSSTVRTEQNFPVIVIFY